MAAPRAPFKFTGKLKFKLNFKFKPTSKFKSLRLTPSRPRAGRLGKLNPSSSAAAPRAARARPGGPARRPGGRPRPRPRPRPPPRRLGHHRDFGLWSVRDYQPLSRLKKKQKKIAWRRLARSSRGSCVRGACVQSQACPGLLL